MPQSVIP